MIDAEGNFNQDFTDALPGMLGDEHADFKDFENIKDMGTLVKNYANTKSAFSKKLENVIQKPGPDATDEQKTEYRNQLMEGIGAPKEVGEYKFERPSLSEGRERNEEQEKGFADFCFQQRFTPEQAQSLVDYADKINATFDKTASEAEETRFTEQSQVVNDKWPGELLPKNVRMAIDFAKEHVYDEDAAKEFDEAKLYDNATDLKLLDKHIGLSQIVLLQRLAENSSPSRSVTNQGTKPGNLSQYEINKKNNPKTPQLWGPKDA